MKKPRIKVEDIALETPMTLNALVKQMRASGGFVAKHVGVGLDVLEKMANDDECTVFFSFPSDIISTGNRGVVRDVVKNKLADVVITTCGTVAHDLARIWKAYYHGNFLLDDAELHRAGINRLGNVLIPNECYGEILEKKLQPLFDVIYKEQKKINPGSRVEFSSRDIIWEIGKRLTDDSSILYWAAKNEIPIFVPGITDGAFGSQLWLFWQRHKKDFAINVLADEEALSDIIFSSKKTGALMIGGGISKHHTIWWNQFRDGLDYAVYITTAPEWDGSLSGARIREAVSWGKVKENAKYVTIEGDATVILPLLIGALFERLGKAEK